ncbi:MAG: lyase family protein, partial [Saprospiraceae bacterium]
DREMTTKLLGFSDLNYNVVHAQMGRGKSELFLSYALAAIGHTLGKMAMDVTLYINQNFNFISFPTELTTGSSIMPHKKNPDFFELIRAKCNKLQALPAEISMITGGMPSGYHRDFQLLKEALFPAIEDVKNCLQIADYALQQMQIKPNILAEEKYKYLYSVEEVNKEVLAGTPFRDAYKKIGLAIDSGNFDPEREVEHTHLGSVGNLATEQIKAKWERVWEGFDFEKTQETIDELVA